MTTTLDTREHVPAPRPPEHTAARAVVLAADQQRRNGKPQPVSPAVYDAITRRWDAAWEFIRAKDALHDYGSANAQCRARFTTASAVYTQAGLALARQQRLADLEATR